MNIFDTLFIPALVVTVILPVALPRRWLTRGLIAWVFSPAALYLVLAVGGAVTDPDHAGALKLYFYGFALMSAFVLVPWLSICAVGYGVGFGLRRLIRGPYVPPPPSVAAPVPPPAQPAPSVPDPPPSPPTPGWRALHVGVSGDGVSVGGLPVWGHDWRPVATPSLRFPHPAHPAQRHDFEVYEIGDPADPVCFAAGELSNGVWGIYVPTDRAAEERQGAPDWRSETSPDGTIRVDVDSQEWGSGLWVASPRVVDLAADQMVLNLWNTDWDARVSFPGPGQVELGLRRFRRNGEMVVILDLARGTWRLVSEPGGPEAPLDGVAGGIEAASARVFAAPLQGSGARRPVKIAWRSGVVIALGAAAAIATAAYVASRRPPAPGPALTPMPVMPDFAVPPAGDRVPAGMSPRPPGSEY